MQPNQPAPPPGFEPEAAPAATTDQSAAPQSQDSAPPPPPAGFVPDQSFTPPGGKTFTPGQKVQHTSGATGTVTGQNPDTGKAEVQWNQNHPGQKYGVEGTIRANDPSSVSGKVARWAEQVSNDVKYGTDFTGVGAFLKKMGAHGVYTGNSQAVGDFMASIPLGLLTTIKGEAELPNAQSAGGVLQSVKDMAGGAAQAATMPTAVVAPESSELENLAGQAVDRGGQAAADAAKAVGGKIADVAHAGATKAGDLVTAASQKVGDVLGVPGKLAEKYAPNLYPPEVKVPTATEAREAIQPAYEQHKLDIRQRIGNIVSKDGLQMEPANSIQQVPVKAAKAYETEANKLYAQVDDAIEAATGRKGRFQELDKAIRGKQDAIDTADATGDLEKGETERNNLDKLTRLRNENLAAIKDKNLSGVPERATAMYKRQKAMEDLTKGIQNHTSDVPGATDTMHERVNPKTFQTALRNLQNNVKWGGSRLEQALGKEDAAGLIKDNNTAYSAVDKARQSLSDTKAAARAALRQRRLAKSAAGLLVGDELVRHL